ncbi:MAG: 4Fe-4S binding protein [Gemmatimonadetes bacterium]|nr:4Fe-4S binding protein [Gemmatimonadota bacterium]
MMSIGIGAPAARRVRRPRSARPVAVLLPILLLAGPVTPLAAQEGVSRELLQRVLPGAERFGERSGDPPVVRGWSVDPSSGEERLVGFAFLTSDVPPEELGYNGPIDVLVGMDASGTVTGVVVVDYYESLRASRGDFLARRGFQEQFTGKTISDAFRVRRDVDGISGATITVAAMSRGIRNAARRVWTVHVLGEAEEDSSPPPVPGADDLRRLSWLEMASRDMLQKMIVQDGGVTRIELTFLRVKDEEAGRALLGGAAWERAMEEAGDRADGRHVWLLGVDGALTALFRSQALFVVQDGDTVRMGGNAVMLGEPRSGKADAQFRNAGLLFVDGAVDVRRPFTFVLDLNNGWGAFTAHYPGEPRSMVASAEPETPESAAAGPPTAPSSGTGEAGPPAAASPEAGEGAPPAASPGAGDSTAPAAPSPGAASTDAPAVRPPEGEAADEDTAAPSNRSPEREDADGATAVPGREGDGDDPSGPPPALPFQLQLDQQMDETVLSRTLDRTSWPRVTALAALLILVSAAFRAKGRPWLRAAALAGTVGVLGIGGGFLSVSHLVAVLKVGPGIFLEDLPLLLLVAFTVVTTLLWGRVFCGYLCPFGALQDALERVVPARFRRELPRAVHERALLAKYGVLALVLLPAAAGSQVTLFQYVEPFGTVFFLSSSALLWAIAAAVLVASAVIPRFYCRYACPLGASLALASVLSPFRIRRVEQCTLCTVCERACPTGAIRREHIDFKECVRCNACETALERRAGVCRHDMDEVRSRLIQIRVGTGEEVRSGR